MLTNFADKASLLAAVARREPKVIVATFDQAFAQALTTLKLNVWQG